MDDAFLKEVLECSVCLEQLTLNSKVLPCQHTFCRRCLEEIVASKGQLLCPECRLPVDRPIAELPNNILLARLLEGIHQKRNLEERRRQAELDLAATQVSVPLGRDPRRNVDRTRSEAAAWIFGETVDSVIPAVQVTPAPRQEEVVVEKFPAKALALYSFAGPEKDDLKFSKGDLLTLISRVDANWYWAERAAAAGLVPANYVQTLCMDKSVPGIALFEFQKDNPSRQYLKFNRASPFQGEHVEFLHKMDDNWAFGKSGGNIGLYPLSYVQMPVSGRRVVPSSKAHHHRHRHSVPIMILSDSALTTHTEASPRHRAVSDQRESTPSSVTCGNAEGGNVAPPPSPKKYVALYNYWPKGKDELELFRGHLYTVQDKCPDGWFRGCCVSTGKSGLFPGNYVRPRSSSDDPAPSPVVPGPSRLKFTSPDRQSGAMSQSVPGPGRSLSCRCREPVSDAGGDPGMRRMSADVLELASFSTPPPTPVGCSGSGDTGDTKHHHHSHATSKAHNWERKPSCGRKALISGSGLFSRLARLSGHSNSPSSSQTAPPSTLPPPPPPGSTPRQRQVYRCITPYPADSVQELELDIGDLILLKEQRSDGWMYGQLQRSGKLGLFPSSFVQLCGSHKSSMSTS